MVDSIAQSCSLLFSPIALREAINVLESQKKYLQAFTYVEELMRLKSKDGSRDVQEEASRRISRANKHALELSSTQQHQPALELLQRSCNLLSLVKEKILQASLKAQTCSNMSVIHKDLNEHKLSLQCLEEAEACLKLVGDEEGLVFCHLNMSSAWSALGKYGRAKECAERAVKVAQTLAAELSASDRAMDKTAILGLAYFNVGLQEEHLKNEEKACESYAKSKKLTEGDPKALDEFKIKANNRASYSTNNRNIKFGNRKSVDQVSNKISTEEVGSQRKVINTNGRIKKKVTINVASPIKASTASKFYPKNNSTNVKPNTTHRKLILNVKTRNGASYYNTSRDVRTAQEERSTNTHDRSIEEREGNKVGKRVLIRDKLKSEIMSDLKTKMPKHKAKQGCYLNADSVEELNLCRDTNLFEWSDDGDESVRPSKAMRAWDERKAFGKAELGRQKAAASYRTLPKSAFGADGPCVGAEEDSDASQERVALCSNDSQGSDEEIVALPNLNQYTKRRNTAASSTNRMRESNKKFQNKGIPNIRKELPAKGSRSRRGRENVRFRTQSPEYRNFIDDASSSYENEDLHYYKHSNRLANSRKNKLTIDTKVISISKYNTQKPVLDIDKKTFILNDEKAYRRKVLASSKSQRSNKVHSLDKAAKIDTSQARYKNSEVEQLKKQLRIRNIKIAEKCLSKSNRKQSTISTKHKPVRNEKLMYILDHKMRPKELLNKNAGRNDDGVFYSINPGLNDALEITNSMASANADDISLSTSQIIYAPNKYPMEERKRAESQSFLNDKSKSQDETIAETSLIENSYPIILEQSYEEDKSEVYDRQRESESNSSKKRMRIELKRNCEEYLDDVELVDGSPIESTKKKLAAVIKLQAVFRAYKARKEHGILKEISVIKSDYRRNEEKRAEILAILYLQQRGVLEVDFVRCEDSRLVHCHKCSCPSELTASLLRVQWQQVMQKSEGNMAVDVNYLMELIGAKKSDLDSPARSVEKRPTQTRNNEESKRCEKNAVKDDSDDAVERDEDRIPQVNVRLANDSLPSPLETPGNNKQATNGASWPNK